MIFHGGLLYFVEEETLHYSFPDSVHTPNRAEELAKEMNIFHAFPSQSGLSHDM